MKKKEEVFTGNADENTVVINNLESPLIVKSLRIKPKTWEWSAAVMRVELYGCAAGWRMN